MGRKKKVILPNAGDAFAVPLEDGRYSVCRVLADRITRPKLSIDAVLVASSAWIGSEIPSVDNPELRPILKLTHHSWDKEKIAWISDPVPDTFIPIGTIAPSDKEAFLNCPSHSDWFSKIQQPLMQWQWDHDPEAVKAADAARKQAQADQAAQQKRQRQEQLKQAKLQDLAKHKFFADWTYPPRKAITASRKIMVDTVQTLIALGKSASESDRLNVLQSCIESFNALDEKLEFIETVEREDICHEFEAIVHACGLGSHENLADEWRDW